MSEEGSKARIAGWLEPIAGASAAGEDARYDPLHEKVRAEAGKLENPASGMPLWDALVRDAESLLTDKSKDLLIASYAACGLWEIEGLDGLASGFFLIAETMDRFWDDMFPPARRLRARVNAIDWLIDRVNLTVAETPLGPTDHDAVAGLEAAAKRLQEVVSARFEDQAPALRTLFDNIQRLKLSLPEREEGAASDTEPPPPPGDDAADPSASGAPGDEVAPAVSESAEAEAEAAVEEAAPEAPKVDHAAELKALAEPYVAPIAGDSPAGTDAKFEPIYEELRNDVTALDSPTGGDLDWNAGVKKAEKILTDHSKDLLIASYLAWGLFETRSVDGLSLGLSILTEICERHWDDCQPPVRRIRGRSNALSWLLDRLEGPLPDVPVTADDKVKVERLQVAVKRFIDVVREKFEDAAPSVRPLQDNVQRLLMSVPEPAAPEPKKAPEPKPAAEKAQPAAAKPAASSGGAAAAVNMPSGGATLADPKEVGKFTREISKSLVDAAKALREAGPTDPISYRLVRLGLAIDTPLIPPAQQGAETPAPPPPDIVITNLEAALSSGNHESLLKISEGTLPTKRFWLDLHRYSAIAMQGLGDTYAAARAEVIAGVALWVKAFPELLEHSFKGGMPFASDVTKEWISAEVMPSGGGGGGGGGGEGAEAIGEAKSLLAGGKLDEALVILDGLAGGARSGRARFRAKLAMAQGLASGSGAEAAEGILDGLAREIEARGLEYWEPELAAECYRAHLSCLKSMKKANDPTVAQQSALVYRRLCRVDPLAALKLG